VPRTVTISAGVAAYPDHGASRDDLIRAADSALYAAKQAGRNRACLAGLTRSASSGQ
jgi:two-component system cell cycle response regulator